MLAIRSPAGYSARILYPVGCKIQYPNCCRKFCVARNNNHHFISLNSRLNLHISFWFSGGGNVYHIHICKWTSAKPRRRMLFLFSLMKYHILVLQHIIKSPQGRKIYKNWENVFTLHAVQTLIIRFRAI